MPRRLALLNALFLLVAVGSVAYIAREVTTPPRPMPLRPRATTTDAPASVQAAPAPMAPGVFAAVASKNLFSPTRSEAPPPAQTGRALNVPKPTLHGVVLREGIPIAYLEDPTTKRVAGYRLGDNVAGGTLKTINADHVVLTRPEGIVDVRLRDPSKPRPAVVGPTPGTATPTTPLTGTGPGTVLPGVPAVGGSIPSQVTATPGAPPTTPPDQIQPGIPMPPRRMPPPNLLRRVPPATTDAQK